MPLISWNILVGVKRDGQASENEYASFVSRLINTMKKNLGEVVKSDGGLIGPVKEGYSKEVTFEQRRPE